MTHNKATSEIFLTAFRALPKKTRKAFIEKLLETKELREDLMDIVIIEQRRRESSRNLDDYITSRRKKGNH